MFELHLINKQKVDGTGLRNLCHSGAGQYRSGYWDIPLEEAKKLVGGMIYLHEKKEKHSRFGGRVLDIELVQKTEFSHSDRIIFVLQSLSEGKGKKWRGKKHAMAAYGGIVPVSD